MERLPDPPERFDVAPDPHTLRAGVIVWRVYDRGGRHATRWNQLRYYGPTDARFDPHLPPSRVQQRGILYGAIGKLAACTAVAEAFQRSRLVDVWSRAPWIVAFALRRDVVLLDTGRLWPLRAGGSAALNSGSRAQARAWARIIYSSYPEVEGLLYPSSMTHAPAVALFERAADGLPADPKFHRALQDPAFLPVLRDLAARIEYSIAPPPIRP